MASVLNTLGVDVSLTEELDENTIKIREAIALYSGIKGKIDYAKAKELFLELAEQGDPLGEMWIARCYDMGRCDFPYDTEKAEKIAGGVIDQVKQLALLCLCKRIMRKPWNGTAKQQD